MAWMAMASSKTGNANKLTTESATIPECSCSCQHMTDLYFRRVKKVLPGFCMHSKGAIESSVIGKYKNMRRVPRAFTALAVLSVLLVISRPMPKHRRRIRTHATKRPTEAP